MFLRSASPRSTSRPTIRSRSLAFRFPEKKAVDLSRRHVTPDPAKFVEELAFIGTQIKVDSA
jgi:hypothetical protein